MAADRAAGNRHRKAGDDRIDGRHHCQLFADDERGRHYRDVGGAVAFGCLVGALYLRYVGREVTLALLVVCLLLSQVGMSQRTEPLLAAMAASIVIANVAVAQGETLKAAIQSGALPLLVVFFVAIGTSLCLDTLATAGLAAVGLAVARVALIWIGVRTGLQVAGVKNSAGEYVWTKPLQYAARAPEGAPV